MLTKKELDKFLAEFCDCYEDSNGNRPCDNGVLCNKCIVHQDELTKIIEQNKKGDN